MGIIAIVLVLAALAAALVSDANNMSHSAR